MNDRSMLFQIFAFFFSKFEFLVFFSAQLNFVKIDLHWNYDIINDSIAHARLYNAFHSKNFVVLIHSYNS